MLGLWRLKLVWHRALTKCRLIAAERAIARFPKVRYKRSHGLPNPLIVCLTSYPARYPTLAKTLKSLLDQNVAADRTILWIGRDDVESLPAQVRALEAHGLEITACDDMRSFTKLVPALQAFPDCVLVTADDDIYYWPEWLGALTDAALESPGVIVAHRCHMALFKVDGSLQPYSKWPMATADCSDTEQGALFPTGVGGVLYPPGTLDTRVTNDASFRALCPQADDVWFFWMARLAGSRPRGLGYQLRFVTWDGTQEVGLLHKNWLGGENDEQIRAMEARFGYIRDVEAIK